MKTLYFGGPILTMAQNETAEAVLVEDGIIAAVGSKENLLKKYGPCECMDLKGSTLMPGFIDSHSHFFQTALSLLQVSLNGVRTSEEIARRINHFLAENPLKPGQWVIARDYDNNRMTDLKNPTMEELNAFCPNNPLVIHHKSGHMGLINAEGLRYLGITADTPAPEGGRIEVVDGKLTGYLEENAFIEAIQRIPMADPAQTIQAFVGAQKKYASYGITTVQDGMVVEQMLPLFEVLLQQKLLCLDVMLYSALDAYQATGEMLKKFPDNTHLVSAGMKIFLDGSPQGRTAWMRKPYEGEDSYCGYGTQTDEAVEHAFEEAARRHTQLLAHCNGDAAAEQFLRCLEKAEEKYPELKKLRPVLIHGQLIGRDQLPRAAKLQAIISFFVAHVYHWGDVHIRNFGMERASAISPVQSALDAGVRVTFHQDTPVIEPDMIETIWCAVNRITESGICLGENERISTLDALKAITINAAYQYSQEDQKGSLEPGKKADMVILDRNPLEVPKEDLRSVQILKTYKDGNCIFSR